MKILHILSKKNNFRNYKSLIVYLEEYLAADLKLYNFFKAKFEEKLHLFGKARMKQEEAKLKAQIEQMKVCILYIHVFLNIYIIKTDSCT